ncbi:MAG: dihydropteroate synthase [Lachnospiraceae bacterium]|nr:dihydropteroate synthase [Lachnospiraceae bacterium]
MKLGKYIFDDKKTYVMGILNYTNDSFSDGGKYNNLDSALKRVEEMIEEGADIIDIGAQSTRPGYEEIDVKEEALILEALVKTIKMHFDIPVSIDSYRASAMKAALHAGADMANDIMGLKYTESDLSMAKVIADFNVPVVIMHADEYDRDYSKRSEEQKKAFNSDVILRVKAGLSDSVNIALEAGIHEEKIILDPGVGFNKTQEENLQVLKHLDEFMKMGYPCLLGASRKSVIGNALNLPVEQREEGTLVTSVLAARAGYNFVRVHDVKANKRAINMFEAINNS